MNSNRSGTIPLIAPLAMLLIAPFAAPAFLCSQQVSSADTEALAREEWHRFIVKTRDAHAAASASGERRYNLARMRDGMVEISNRYPESKLVDHFLGDDLWSGYLLRPASYGLDNPAAFLDTLATSAAPSVRSYARGAKNILALTREPMRLKGTAIDGRPIDLQELRGKAVLLYFWDRPCMTCWQHTLPAMDKLYRKYRNQGFELISVFMEHGEEQGRWLRELVKKNNYEHLTYYDAAWKSVQETYQFRASGQSFLLNRKGVLIDHNLADESRYEAAIQNAL